MRVLALDKLGQLEKHRRMCVSNLQSARKALECAKEVMRLAEAAEYEAQRQVNYWQDELDETDKQIQLQMEIERDEREGEG
jgi:hypothetical protein